MVVGGGDVSMMMSEIGEQAENDEERLWRAHAGELTRYATLLVGPADASDLVSIAFLKVMRKLATVHDVRAYLFRVVTTVAHDQRRSQQRRQVRDLHAVLPIATEVEAMGIDTRRAVARLSVRQRAVVYFTYWEDLNAPQVAEVLGIGTNSVRRHLARARSHLRKALQ